MKPGLRNGILAIALLGFGALRMPFEANLAKDLREEGLLPEPLAIGTSERIGQTSTAVALGGLRTLVATFLNLRAFGFFERQKWDDVAETFDMIVDLAPHTRYYWETGAWHSAYNAASYYLYESKQPPLRRREAWRGAISRGKDFLQRGIKNNPDDWSLHAEVARLLCDPNKFPAFHDINATFSEATDEFQRAMDTGDAPAFIPRFRFYAMARVAGREKEALALGHELYADERNRTPTLVMLMLVLEAHEDPKMDVAKRAVELFGSPEKALEALAGHWHRTREHFPVYGVPQAIQSLEKSLGTPPEKSVLNQPMAPVRGPDDWFDKVQPAAPAPKSK